MPRSLLLLLALCTVGASAYLLTPFCVGGTQEPFSVADDDQIEVWYVEAPVFEYQYGDLMGYVHAYHSALALFDRTSGQNWTIEYDAVSGVPNATIPMLKTNNVTGQTELVWFGNGSVCVRASYNESYWSAKQTPVALINGTILNAYWPWIEKYNVTLTTYQLWNVYPSYNSSLYTDASVNTQDCFEFVWDSFRWFLWAGVQFYPGIAPARDFVNLYSATPQPVNMSDPAEAADVMQFYSTLESVKVSSVTDFVQLLLKIEPIDKFIYVNGQYLRMSFVFPYFAIRYDVWWPVEPSPGPWTTAPPTSL